ncbi:hypothetical protein AAG906_001575 [Vitis piasezkii]
MAEENQVKLHGIWASPYVKRVEMALKLKGIPCEYVEEDLRNKSQLLLQYNPVHKKVSVLIHNGKPIAESLIMNILMKPGRMVLYFCLRIPIKGPKFASGPALSSKR